MEFETSRLDKYIRRRYGKRIPQSMIEIAIKNGDILVNGGRTRASDKVSETDNVFVYHSVCRMFEAVMHSSKPKAPVDYSRFITELKDMIIYEDDDLIIVNKPPGLPVQLGSKMRISVDVMAKAYNPEARLVHRIDKETSGVVVLAKNLFTARYMLYLFQNKEIYKKYMAVVAGKLSAAEGVISKPLTRAGSTSIVDFEYGKEAVTKFRVLETIAQGRTLIEAIPLTGRTHQIRVHFSAISCPIVGDRRFNGPKFKYLCLHANEISFTLSNCRKISVIAPVPPYFQTVPGDE
ncbi:MAG: RluA family pseudouridine synthase [Holosporales bacterium]|jgi:23S rRNA pseudouridine955/2504/2580 synthase|nr:RluA family pseudouridine synthase [Holosporales bacterium]